MKNKIKILQGANTIGGNIVLIEGEQSRLILDFGIPLTDVEGTATNIKLYDSIAKKYLPKLPDLYSEHQQKQTLVFISHAHPDHYGLTRYLNRNIPIYCTKITKDFIQKGSRLLYKGIFDDLNLVEITENISTTDFEVKTFTVNHSISGSCAFKIRDKQTNETLLYCGDIRLHGRLDKSFNEFIEQNKNADYAILEGTTLSRNSEFRKTEDDIEKEMIELFKESKLNLVAFSPLNTDRMTSVYNAVQNAGKTLVIDSYTAFISGDNEIKYNRQNIKIFCISDGNTEKIFDDETYKEKYGRNKISKYEIINNPEKYVIKDSRAISEFLSKHHDFEKANLIYSYLGGYMDRGSFRWEKYRNQIKQIHTSGHIDEDNLKELVNILKPKKIIPIHTIASNRFKELFGDKILLL